jgi:hypothetical protein
MSHVDCDCGLCKPLPGKRYDPEYGFDLDAVKDVNCLTCDTPIGEEPYSLVTMLARFGTMSFVHKRCEK